MQTSWHRARCLHILCFALALVLGATLLVTSFPAVLTHSHHNVKLMLRERSSNTVDTVDCSKMPSVASSAWRPWLQSNDIHLSAVVFFGRRKYVRILDKYLKRNLWRAGGIVEEVRSTTVKLFVVCSSTGFLHEKIVSGAVAGSHGGSPGSAMA